jgi:hypothetical protein
MSRASEHATVEATHRGEPADRIDKIGPDEPIDTSESSDRTDPTGSRAAHRSGHAGRPTHSQRT